MKIALCVGFMFFRSIWALGKWDYDKMKAIGDQKPIVYGDSCDKFKQTSETYLNSHIIGVSDTRRVSSMFSP